MTFVLFQKKICNVQTTHWRIPIFLYIVLRSVHQFHSVMSICCTRVLDAVCTMMLFAPKSDLITQKTVNMPSSKYGWNNDQSCWELWQFTVSLYGSPWSTVIKLVLASVLCFNHWQLAVYLLSFQHSGMNLIVKHNIVACNDGGFSICCLVGKTKTNKTISTEANCYKETIVCSCVHGVSRDGGHCWLSSIHLVLKFSLGKESEWKETQQTLQVFNARFTDCIQCRHKTHVSPKRTQINAVVHLLAYQIRPR